MRIVLELSVHVMKTHSQAKQTHSLIIYSLINCNLLNMPEPNQDVQNVLPSCWAFQRTRAWGAAINLSFDNIENRWVDSPLKSSQS